LSIARGVAKTAANPDFDRHARACAVRAGKRGRAMAEQGMKAANETYAGFLSMLKIGTIITVIVAAFVVLLIAS
jgi:hypothetical protein